MGFASSTGKSANGPTGSLEEELPKIQSAQSSSDYEEVEEEFEEEVEEDLDDEIQEDPTSYEPEGYSIYKPGNIREVDTIEEGVLS